MGFEPGSSRYEADSIQMCYLASVKLMKVTFNNILNLKYKEYLLRYSVDGKIDEYDFSQLCLCISS